MNKDSQHVVKLITSSVDEKMDFSYLILSQSRYKKEEGTFHNHLFFATPQNMTRVKPQVIFDSAKCLEKVQSLYLEVTSGVRKLERKDEITLLGVMAELNDIFFSSAGIRPFTDRDWFLEKFPYIFTHLSVMVLNLFRFKKDETGDRIFSYEQPKPELFSTNLIQFNMKGVPSFAAPIFIYCGEVEGYNVNLFLRQGPAHCKLTFKIKNYVNLLHNLNDVLLTFYNKGRKTKSIAPKSLIINDDPSLSIKVGPAYDDMVHLYFGDGVFLIGNNEFDVLDLTTNIAIAIRTTIGEMTDVR